MFLAKKFLCCKVCSGSHKRHNEQGAIQCYQAFLVCQVCLALSNWPWLPFSSPWTCSQGFFFLFSFFLWNDQTLTFVWHPDFFQLFWTVADCFLWGRKTIFFSDREFVVFFWLRWIQSNMFSFLNSLLNFDFLASYFHIVFSKFPSSFTWFCF